MGDKNKNKKSQRQLDSKYINIILKFFYKIFIIYYIIEPTHKKSGNNYVVLFHFLCFEKKIKTLKITIKIKF